MDAVKDAVYGDRGVGRVAVEPLGAHRWTILADVLQFEHGTLHEE